MAATATMSDLGWFTLAFALTASGVAASAALGRAGRRRPHLCAAATTFALFGWTVWRAELLGRGLDIAPAYLALHLTFAGLGTLALLAVAATGMALLRGERPERRRRHRRAIGWFLVLLAVAAATGTWMIVQARPRPVEPGPRRP